MGFFHPSTEDEQATLWAQRLYRLAVKHGRMRAQKMPGTWPGQFVALRSRKGAAKIGELLDWYESAAGREYIPGVWDANSFVVRWDQLKAAMEKDTELLLAQKIAPQDLALVRRLANEDYPPEITSYLPVLVQRTREAWADFVVKILERVNGTTREGKFLASIQTECFVQEWFDLLLARYGGLEHYNGWLASLAFRPQSRLFRESCWHYWSERWCGDPRAFDSLLEDMLS